MIAGIDPGVHGAIAFLDRNGRLIDVIDMPTVLLSKKQQPSAIIVKEELRSRRVTTVIIERVSGGIARPDGGKPSNPGLAAARAAGGFNFGYGAGAIYGLCIGMDIHPIHLAPPATWKKAMKVTSDKETSRALALQLWPHMAGHFRYIKNENRAEAALIGLYGLRHLIE